jgi:hypothetical protein
MKPYISLQVSQLGSVVGITLGSGGSSVDGQGTLTQRGGGNDDGKGKSGK